MKKVIHKEKNARQLEEEIAVRLSVPAEPLSSEESLRITETLKDPTVYVTQGENYFTFTHGVILEHLTKHPVMLFRFLRHPTEYGLWEFTVFSKFVNRTSSLAEGKTTIGSGNKWVQPGDVMFEEFLIEAKQRRDFSIERPWLEKVKGEAESINKDYALMFRMKGCDPIFVVQPRLSVENMIDAKQYTKEG